MLIRLSPGQINEIRVFAQDAYPNECCGLLAGRTAANGDITVTRIVTSPNTRIDDQGHGGQDRFEVDPQVRFDLMRALQGSDETIVGHYHSHPDHPAEPSETDLDQAFEPDLVWLIVAVEQDKAGEITAWRLNRETRTRQNVYLEVERG